MAAVARRMGVAPATLRTWDRRYGIGPSEHRVGAHRRYSAVDVARLEHMRRLVIAGIPPADAAKLARDVPAADLRPAGAGSPTVERLADRADGGAPAGRQGGGRVVALPGAAPAVRGLARAAQSLDSTACVALITEALDRRGAVWTWDALLVPVLTAVGRRWSETGEGIEIEHVLSSAVQDAMTAKIRSVRSPVNARPVILACAPDDLHSLPLWALAAALAELGIESRVLGARMPAHSLVEAVRRIGPAAVFIWAQVPDTADAGMLAQLPALRPAATTIIGGPGWAGALPHGVWRATSLPNAVARIAHAVGE